MPSQLVADSELLMNLTQIHPNYNCLIDTVKWLETPTSGIAEVYEKLSDLNFAFDSCGVFEYVTKCIKKNEMSDIVLQIGSEISPAFYAFLNNALATTSLLERSFSILKKKKKRSEICNHAM